MKIFKKFFGLCLAFVMMLSIIPTAFAASSTTATIDTSRKASLDLYKYDFTSANEAGVLQWDSYVSDGKQNSAAESSLTKYALQGVVFTYVKVADITTYSKNEGGAYNNAVLYSFPKGDKTNTFLSDIGLSISDAYSSDTTTVSFTSDKLIKALGEKLDANPSATKNDLEKFVANYDGAQMPETNDKGYSSVSDLDLGLYLVVETSVPENVSVTTAPFLVSLPMTTIDGLDWNYNVTVYPKNETDSPNLEKTLRESKADTGKNIGTANDIKDGYAHTATGSDGDVIDYQLISTLPSITSNATSLSEYTFVDTLSKGIEYNKNDVKIEWYKDADCTELITAWTQADGKFTVSYGTSDNGSTTMTVKMTADGLNEVNHSEAVYDSDSVYNGYSDCTVRITYSCTVNSNADVVYGDNGNPNEVTLTWKRSNMEYYDTLKDDCHFYTYGIDMTKEFSDKLGNFENVQFIIHNDTDNYWVTAELNEAEGVYYVTGHVADEASATVFTPVTSNGDEGKIIVKGLEDDAYTLTEIKTDKGYTLLKKAIKVVITSSENKDICSVCGKHGLTATATLNGDAVNMSEDNGSLHALVPFKVVNHKGFDIPITGAEGLFGFALFAVVLLSGSLAFALSLSRKRKREKN